MAKDAGKKITIKLLRSHIARPAKQRAVLIGLGLTRVNKQVVRSDTPEIRGMINKVSHLVSVEDA